MTQRTDRQAHDARSRVLIVEDDEDTGAMLASMLEDRGYSVKWAQHGEEGLRHCIAAARAGTAPHLVLLDLRLPDMDGADLARSLARSLDGAPPIIVLSALPAQIVQEKARQIGARAALRKPFDVQRLLESVAASLDPTTVAARMATRPGISDELLAALHLLMARLPELGSIRGGVAESSAWAAAHAVVMNATRELGPTRIAALGFDVALAQCTYLAASDAQEALNTARITRGAAQLDFALADSYCYSLLNLAIVLGRALIAEPSPAEGRA